MLEISGACRQEVMHDYNLGFISNEDIYEHVKHTCHPTETRPLTVREYARIQTFPDDWEFCGTLSAKYKQIGNAVPVNMAWALGRALVRLFNQIDACLESEDKYGEKDADCVPPVKLHGLFEGMACDKEYDYPNLNQRDKTD